MDTASDCLFISTCIIRWFSLQLKYSDVNLHSSGIWASAPNSSICAKNVTSPQCCVVKARFCADVFSSEGIHSNTARVCVCKCMCTHMYAGCPFIWLIPRISNTLIATTILRPKHFILGKTAFSQRSVVFFFLLIRFPLKLAHQMERFPNPLDLSNVSIWERARSKRLKKEGTTWKVMGWTSRLSQSSEQISFV